MSSFRFGVSMATLDDKQSWVKKCQLAESLGYDIITVPDHLGMPAPFPALMSAAQVTSQIHVGTFVTNAAFHRPAVLAREVTTMTALTEGRFELGLGAGWVRDEFSQAGIPFESLPQRLRHLNKTLAAVRESDTGAEVRVMIGGNSDRVLDLAARTADIVSLSGARFDRQGRGMDLRTAGEVDERVSALDDALLRAGGRTVERNLIVLRTEITDDRDAALRACAARISSTVRPEQLADCPVVLIGTVEQITEQLRDRRRRFGVSYFVVQEHALAAFAPVIEELTR